MAFSCFNLRLLINKINEIAFFAFVFQVLVEGRRSLAVPLMMEKTRCFHDEDKMAIENELLNLKHHVKAVKMNMKNWGDKAASPTPHIFILCFASSSLFFFSSQEKLN